MTLLLFNPEALYQSCHLCKSYQRSGIKAIEASPPDLLSHKEEAAQQYITKQHLFQIILLYTHEACGSMLNLQTKAEVEGLLFFLR